tara:strand:- start:189 stop:380 length:192 start_codon:yes stop_codon:yes gene_type:complete
VFWCGCSINLTKASRFLKLKLLVYSAKKCGAEVLPYLTSGWGEVVITELKLEYLYGLVIETSG